MNKILTTLLLAAAWTGVFAQSAKELKQVSMAKWNIGASGYSGITALGGNRYAILSDHDPKDGFYTFRIDQNDHTGAVSGIYMEGFKGNRHPTVDANGNSIRDTEGIAYFPPANTVFISGEGDMQILEYDLQGQPTGRSLAVPPPFSKGNIVHNYGFEALCYDTVRHRFWTTTESMLKSDGTAAGPLHPTARNLLRLQSFGDNLQPSAQYAYRMDEGRKDDFGKGYFYGVPALTTLPDGRVLVLEREANITSGGLSSTVRCKLYLVNPDEGHRIDSSTEIARLDPNKFLVKTLLADWTTQVQPFRLNFANYEGMCLGQQLSDGRQTVLLISDSQYGYRKGPFHLKDYIKVIVIGH